MVGDLSLFFVFFLLWGGGLKRFFRTPSYLFACLVCVCVCVCVRCISDTAIKFLEKQAQELGLQFRTWTGERECVSRGCNGQSKGCFFRVACSDVVVTGLWPLVCQSQ